MRSNITFRIKKNFSIEESIVFRTEINKLIERNENNFILDFSECEFIDSTGLGVIVSAYKKCVEKGITFKLVSLNGQVEKVFKLTRLDKVFNIN